MPVLSGRGERQAPPNIDPDTVNWVCDPPDATQQWRLAGVLVWAVVAEGEAVASMMGHYAVDERYVFGHTSSRQCARSCAAGRSTARAS